MKTTNKTGINSILGFDVDVDSIKKSIPSSDLLALEPRILFDGAAVVTGVEAFDNVENGVDGVADSSQDEALAILSNDLFDALSQTQTTNGDRQEIVFVDTSVDDYQVLLEEFGDNVEVVLLDASGDGVEQIAEVLKGRDDIDAVHIISHGQAGSLSLGGAQLTQDSITGEYAEELAVIAQALSENGDILIYGCNFGEGELGQNAVKALATATGADVAASDDLTGAAALGGDWDLEVKTGVIEAGIISSTDFVSSLAKQVINPAGGQAADGSDGLAIHVIDNGQVQIEYQMNGNAGGNFQLYSPSTNTESTSLFNGIYLAIGNDVTGSNNGSDGAAQSSFWGETSQTSSGAGTSSDPFIVTTTMFTDIDGNGTYNPNDDALVVVETIYVVPNAYFTQRVTVTPPIGNVDVIKFYSTMDTFLSGGDNGPAFSLPQNLAQTNDTVGDASLVGVRKDPGGPNDSFVAFAEVQGGRQFDHWYSGHYNASDLYGNGAGSGIQNGGEIVNTWNTNAATDNGLGIQFTLGAISAPEVFEYNVAFSGEATIDLDVDDSSGATGSGYNTIYTIGSGDTIAIADVDAAISNIVGDIQELRIEISNAEAGDSLTVNLANLPAGVQVQSQTSTQIILEAVGTPQTEAVFDAALQEIGFTTSSAVVTTRNVEVAVTNELGQEGFGSGGAIVINRAPVAVGDSAATDENTAISITAANGVITPNDTDADGHSLTVVEVNGAAGDVGNQITLASGALVTLNADGSYDYDPNGAFDNLSGAASTTDSFSYTVSDGNGGTDTATVTVTIAGANDEPSGSDATLSINEDVPYTFAAADFGFSDAVNGDGFQSVTVQPPANGVLTFNGVPVNVATVVPAANIGLLVYTPVSNANGVGIDSFSFQVTDDGGTANGGQNTDQTANTITFDVASVNDAPTLDNDANDSAGVGAGGYDTTFTENTAAVGIVDSDVDIADVDTDLITEATITLTNGQIGDVLNVGGMPAGLAAVAMPNPPGPLVAAGTITVTIIGNGTSADYEAALQAITFQTNGENPNTTDRLLDIQVSENMDSSNTTTTTIHVIAVNDNPVLDLDGDNSSGINSGNFASTYTENGPALPIADIDTVIQDLDDTNIESATITLTNGQIGDLLSIGVLPAGISLVGVAPTALGAAGVVTVQLTGSASLADYQTALAAIGFSSTSEDPDTTQRAITVVVNDGSLNSNTSTNFVTVLKVNDAPVAVDDAATTNEDTGFSIAAAAGLIDTNDTDFDASDTLAVSQVNGAAGDVGNQITLPSGALLTVNGDGSYDYDPNGAFENLAVGDTGADSFTYTISDGNGGTDTATVNLTITGVNDAPVAVNDAASTDENTGFSIAAAAGLIDTNDTDLDASDTLAISQVNGSAGDVGNQITLPSGALLTVNGDGSYDYDPNGAFESLAVGNTGADSFTYTISDGNGGTDTATVNLTITGVNDAPVIIDPSNPAIAPADPNNIISDVSSADGDTPAILDASAFFNDPDGDPLTFSAVDLPLGLTIDAVTGVISGTIDPSASQGGNDPVGAPGVYTATITADDGNGGVVATTVTYTISNPAPVAVGTLPDLEQHDADDILIDAASVFDDPDGDVLTFTATGLPIGLSIDPVTGEISGTIDDVASDSGPYTITVFADDGEGGAVSVTFTMEVLANGLPLPPETLAGLGPDAVQGSLGNDPNKLAGAGASILSEALDDLESLDGGPNFGPGQDSFITELVAWIGEQGKGWMDGLLSSDGYDAHLGQSLDLDVTFDGAGENASLRIKTLVVDGVVFVELSTIGGQSTLLANLSVLGLEGSATPQTVLRIDERSLAINQIVDQEWMNLRLQAVFEGGVSEFWDVKINMISGEVIAENHGGGSLTFNGFNEQIQRFASASDVANKQLFDAL